MLNEFREILELADKMEELAGSTTDFELYHRIKYDINHIRRMIKSELHTLETCLMKDYQSAQQAVAADPASSPFKQAAGLFKSE